MLLPVEPVTTLPGLITRLATLSGGRLSRIIPADHDRDTRQPAPVMEGKLRSIVVAIVWVATLSAILAWALWGPSCYLPPVRAAARLSSWPRQSRRCSMRRCRTPARLSAPLSRRQTCLPSIAKRVLWQPDHYQNTCTEEVEGRDGNKHVIWRITALSALPHWLIRASRHPHR